MIILYSLARDRLETNWFTTDILRPSKTLLPIIEANEMEDILGLQRRM